MSGIGTGLKVPNNSRRGSTSSAPAKAGKEHHDLEKCPCGQSNGSSYKLSCTGSDCKQQWHLDCVGLKGLPKPSILKLEHWLCPFCYVAPTSTLKKDTSFCLKCRNTLTLQQACSDFETNMACEKLHHLQTLGKSLSTIDVEKMKESLETIQNFDLHLQHLLTNEHSLKEHQNKIESIEKHLEKMSTSYMNNVNDSDTSGLILQAVNDLQKEIQELSSKERLTIDHAPEINTEKIIHDIVDKLDQFVNQEPDLKSELSDIKQSLDRISSTSFPQPTTKPQSALNETHILASKVFKQTETPIEHFEEEFIDRKTEASLLEFCESVTFSEENGHSVCSFGEKYVYSGSKSSNEPTDIPPIIASLVDKINNKYCNDGDPKINSVLVNRYKVNEGFLPEHSDNEPVIHPESDIVTLSVGGVCDVLFTTADKDLPDPYTYTHRCNPRSLYLMTRRSQAHFKHSISQGSVTGSMRYSFTFRSLSPFNRSATCIFSDSNGAGMRFGSDPKRSFGKWLPGKNFFTPVIDNIDPFLTSINVVNL